MIYYKDHYPSLKHNTFMNFKAYNLHLLNKCKLNKYQLFTAIHIKMITKEEAQTSL